jgi:hypothetical protein
MSTRSILGAVPPLLAVPRARWGWLEGRGLERLGSDRGRGARCCDFDLEAQLVEVIPLRHDAKAVVAGGRSVCHHDDRGAGHEALDCGHRVDGLGERVAAVEHDDRGGERRRDGTRVLVPSHDRDFVAVARDQEAHQPEESTVVRADEDADRTSRDWVCDATPPENRGNERNGPAVVASPTNVQDRRVL